MKSFDEKVKDIVDVREHETIKDLLADPAKTLSNYHFTDATSELMCKWLDRIATVQSQGGTAFALAGYRGVGKSHFLSSLGALVSRPDLRSKVPDTHVASSAQSLFRRHYPIAYVRRGTLPTLLDEFKEAMATVFDASVENMGDSIPGILEAVSGKSGDLPFVLIIDTAFERGTRVSRDDGPTLAEIAETAKRLNIFVGVALDDDIAGADGPNSSIARSFAIDYLDQEHLYKVVNSQIFVKKPTKQQTVQELYTYFREVLPSFRWSEYKFSTLYPLHPAILEIAPFVRLYVHDFALLSFASIAGERILARPANSLIGLDSVFDNAEKGLRKIKDLEEAFAAYDILNSGVIAEIPVMQRLQAKLVLKALMLLSLDGQGATAAEISAGMLIYDEADPLKAVTIVHDYVQKFADALPDDIQIHAEEGRQTRYGFKVSSKDNLNRAVAEAVPEVSKDVIPKILRNMMIDRFDDCSFSSESDDVRKDWMDTQIEWRGGIRRGRIFWAAPDSVGLSEHAVTADSMMDWEVQIDLGSADAAGSSGDIPRVIWKPDELRAEEIETILRYYVLSTNTKIREEFPEQIGASLHAHTFSVEKIFSRAFLEDGKLVIDGFDFNCTDEAKTSQEMSGVFASMLEPLFETRYPSHPQFVQRLGVPEVAMLAEQLYGGSRHDLAEVQPLAHVFALPLGLVEQQGGMLVPETFEKLSRLPLIDQILKLVAKSDGETILMKDVYGDLRKPPYGLAREAQHLLLTALVAQRRIEFVTSKGDRINHRSLDLKLIWDDVLGIAVPEGAVHSAKLLAKWATIFVGHEVKSVDASAEQKAVREAFVAWLKEWTDMNIVERFGRVPDHILNARVWQLAAHSGRTLGATAENLTSAIDESITIGEALSRVADIFSDSEEQFEIAKSEMMMVDSFIKGAAMRAEITSYMSGCDLTENEDIEETREQLLQAVDSSYRSPSDASNREMGYLWIKFQRDYGEYFAMRHDAVMRSHTILEGYHEVLRSDEWWEYENLASALSFENPMWGTTEDIKRRFRELGCNFDVREGMKLRPSCVCSFALSSEADWEMFPRTFAETVAAGLADMKRSVVQRKGQIAPMLEAVAKNNGHKDESNIATGLIKKIGSEKDLASLSRPEIAVLRAALSSHPEADHKGGKKTVPNKEVFSEELVLPSI